MGLGDFFDMPINGITYKKTYYIHPDIEYNLKIHFHELVHVVQRNLLGAKRFISRYINELQRYGYESAPLEKMAYFLDEYYNSGGKKIDVNSYVELKIS
jgi:hypothetical protein